MFIKRLNKIYAPTPHSVPNQNSKQNGQANTDQPKKQSEQDLFCNKPLNIFSINLDPHGSLICLYSEKHDEIYIISILTLLAYIQGFRNEFTKNGEYSFKKSLRPQIIIKNPRTSNHIFQIKFSHKVQGTQFLIVIYYSGYIDMYSVVSGKKIDSFNIMERTLQMNEAGIPIYNVNVIGHSVFISLYDGKLMSYEGRQLSLCNKFKGEWVRIGYGEVEVEQTKNVQKKKDDVSKNKPDSKKLKKVPIYYDLQGNLKMGNQILQNSSGITKIKQKQLKNGSEEPLTQSYIQFLRLESQKVSLEGIYRKFTLSLCERYIICKNEEEDVRGEQNVFVYYTIRSRDTNFQLMGQFIFLNFPMINHFWGSNSQKDKSIEDDFIKYYMGTSDILIVVVGNFYPESTLRRGRGNKCLRPKNYEQQTKQTAISIVKIVKTQAGIYAQLICKLEDAKSNISQIQWIGPNILLYLDQSNNVYYMEINPNLLQ